MRWSYPRFKIPCACGCGEEIDNRDRWGTQRFYKNGHFFKGKTKIPTDRHCSKCGSYKTHARFHEKGYWNYRWKKHDGKWYCNKCSSKYFVNPIIHKFYGPRRITLKGRRIQLQAIPRTGQCSDCLKRVGDEFTNWKGETKIIKRTAMHHLQYDLDNPLKYTIELCPRCHKNRHLTDGRNFVVMERNP